MNLAGAKVVVTGGAGFIGSELTRQLCEARAGVCVLDNLINGSEANLAALANPPRLIRGDVRDAALLREVLRGCDVVFHLACLGVRHSLGHPLENHEVNATGTMRVLEAALEAGVSRLVHVSTSEVYGSAESVPMTEDHPTRPTTVYGASKLAGESYARAFFTAHALPVVIVRPFNAYGPRSHHAGDAGEVIPRFIVNLMQRRPLVVFGDGRQTRDFTFVRDIARGILSAGTIDGAEGSIFNLGSGLETSIETLGEMLARLTGIPAEFRLLPARPGEIRRIVADAENARRLLGWEPRTPLADGLAETIAWFSARFDQGTIRAGTDAATLNWLAPANRNPAFTASPPEPHRAEAGTPCSNPL